MRLLSLPRRVARILNLPYRRFSIGVAQIFNLLYRRFSIGRRATTQWFRHGLAPADCKSAIQQIINLRYGGKRYPALICLSLILSVPAFAQGSYRTNGTEYAIAGALPGDQLHPHLALNAKGGYLVWEDNITDGYGLGVSALRLDSGFSGSLAPFRVNATAVDDQEQPQVALLSDGGAAFVWLGGKQGFQHIYARFLSSSNTWLSTTDIVVNAVATKYQAPPAIAALANGNVAILYSSFGQQAADSMQDVYGQILSPSGQRIGGEFLVNQFTAFNQRSQAVAPLSGGGFVVAWVSEQQRSGPVDNPSSAALYGITNLPSVDVFARLYSANGSPMGNEFLVNSSSDVCSGPQVAAGSDGGFMVTWAARNPQIHDYGWDIFARPFSGSGAGGPIGLVNTYQYGDQYVPRISASGTDYLLVWTSLGQDGSREGVFGQFLQGNGAPIGGEMRVNATTISQQIHPAVSSDGAGQFLVTWSSFTGVATGFDLFGQRYLNVSQPLTGMSAPFVYVPFVVSNGAYQPQLQVSWPVEAGLVVDHYDVYVDGGVLPAASPTNNVWTLTGITPSSTHSFQVDYVTTDGRQSAKSPAASATTWMGFSWYGSIPFEWMSAHYGSDTSKWPPLNAAVAPGGPGLLQTFLTGANPLDPTTWLQQKLVASPQGYFLTWNPQPGLTYQLQTSSDLSHWTNLGSARFAAGITDSIYVGGQNTGYYRVQVLR